MTDHAKTIRDALMWAQAYAPDRLAHRLIDAEESLQALLAGHAAEVEQLREKVRLLTVLRDALGPDGPYIAVGRAWAKSAHSWERKRDEARAENERLREALNQHRPPSCPCRACEAVKLAAAQEPPASTSTDVKDGRCQKCGGFPLLDECGCLSGPWQEPPAEGGDRDE